MNLNKVIIIGRLTADPQLRTTPTGASVASFSIATSRVWTDKGGTKQEEVEYHNIVTWGRQAEIASQFLMKGGLVMIEGRLRTRSWQDKQGQQRKTTEIICERLQLGPRSSNPNQGGNASSGGFAKPSAFSPAPAKTPEQTPALDEMPVINMEEEGAGEIKPEDLPF